MANNTNKLTDSPATYSPVFCALTRGACQQLMQQMQREIDRIDNRFFALMLLGATQLLAVTGALGYFILTRVQLVEKIQAVKDVIIQ